MGRKGQAPEQIIAKLREAEVSLAKVYQTSVRQSVGAQLGPLDNCIEKCFS